MPTDEFTTGAAQETESREMFDQERARRRGRGPMFEGHAAPGRHRSHRGFAAFGGFGAMMGGRGPMVRRGDVRSAILTLLAEQPMHGYQIIQELGERSGGRWRPSAGSIYPTLQQLEDEGLVRAEERDARRVFSLTDTGREQAGRQPGLGRRPWDVPGDDSSELRELMFQVMAATKQVAEVGTPDVVSRARLILIETRRALYRLLAEDDAAATQADATIDPTV